MDTAVQWFLLNILSPLLLPVIVVATLAVFFGLRPDALVGTLVGAVVTVCVVIFKTVELIFLVIYQVWRYSKTKKGEKVPATPRRKRPSEVARR